MLPSSTQLARPLNHDSPSTLMVIFTGVGLGRPGPGPHIGQSPEAVLQAAVGLLHHDGVEAGAGHDREALAVDHADVEAAPGPVQGDVDRGGQVVGHAEVGGQQVGGAGRQDGDGDVCARHRVDAALHGPVAAPQEEQVGAVSRSPCGPWPGPCGSWPPRTRWDR